MNKETDVPGISGALRRLAGRRRPLAAIILVAMVLAIAYGWLVPRTRFSNPEPGDSWADHVKWLWDMEVMEWPAWVEDPPQPAPPATVGPGSLRVTYVNQSTVLIQLDSLTILTDPIWSDTAGPSSWPWMGVPRVRAPGVRFEDLPPVDVVLISHDHYDHLDLPTLRRLIERDRPLVLAGLNVGAITRSVDAKVIELDWWQAHRHASGATITSVPARHESGRGIFDGNATLWGGFVIEHGSARVLFFGDTAYGSFVDEIRRRFPCFDVALLPIGNYEPRWFMGTGHMHPEEAVTMHRTLNVRQSIAVHYATFREHPEQAIDAHEKDLRAALTAAGIPDADFWVLGFGEGRPVPLQPCGAATQ